MKTEFIKEIEPAEGKSNRKDAGNKKFNKSNTNVCGKSQQQKESCGEQNISAGRQCEESQCGQISKERDWSKRHGV